MKNFSFIPRNFKLDALVEFKSELEKLRGCYSCIGLSKQKQQFIIKNGIIALKNIYLISPIIQADNFFYSETRIYYLGFRDILT